MTALDIATLSLDEARPANIIVSEGCQLNEILKTMEDHYVRRAYVVDKQSRVVNVVTQTSLLHTVYRNTNLIRSSILKKQIQDSSLMTKNLTYVNTNNFVIDAFKNIIDNKVSSIPIVDSTGKLIGHIGLTDIIDVVRDNRFVRDLYKTTGAFLDEKGADKEDRFFTCLPVDTVETAIARMHKNGLNSVWIVDRQSTLQGVVSFSDLLKSLEK